MFLYNSIKLTIDEVQLRSNENKVSLKRIQLMSILGYVAKDNWVIKC